MKAGRVEPGPSVSTLVLLVLSILVIASTFALAVAGVWLVMSVGGAIGIALGLGLVGIAFLLRPRMGTPQPFLDRKENEALFGIPDIVAASLGVRPPDGIAVTSSFNASVSIVGWRRLRILELGLPLMAILERDERTAILVHEFGHFKNGDPLRGFIGSTAVATLEAWYDLIHPDRGPKSASIADEVPQVEGALVAFLVLPATALLTALSWVPLAMARGLQLLNLAASQRGEYYADLLASRAVGRRSAVAALEKLHLEPTVTAIVGVATRDRWPNGDVWEALASRISMIPAGQLERARRVDRERITSFGTSHPPTPNRVKLVEALGPTTGSLSIRLPLADAFEAALRSHAGRVGDELVDDYRDSLYAG